MKAWNHFCTITHHKFLVMKSCFRVGLYKQGLLHDLSKYSWTEFRVGAKYFQGNYSPNNAEKADKGLSLSWLHHKGRNKHHFEYWIDYPAGGNGVLSGMKMPNRYIVEMVMDRIAASKVYLKGEYTDASALNYYNRSRERLKPVLHPHTRELLELLLNMLAEQGEDATFAYIRKNISYKE